MKQMFSIKGREAQSPDPHLSTCGIHSGSDRFRVWPPVHIEVEVGKLAPQVTLQISMQLSQKPVHCDTTITYTTQSPSLHHKLQALVYDNWLNRDGTFSYQRWMCLMFTCMLWR